MPVDPAARWTPLDATALVARLEEAKALLEQAVAVAAAQDGGRVTPLVELQRRLVEDTRGDDDRRRYR
jgi:hypothetical protein